jgi:hypothetical protein
VKPSLIALLNQEPGVKTGFTLQKRYSEPEIIQVAKDK